MEAKAESFIVVASCHFFDRLTQYRTKFAEIVFPSTFVIHPIANCFIADELRCTDGIIDRRILFGLPIGFKLKIGSHDIDHKSVISYTTAPSIRFSEKFRIKSRPPLR